MPGRIALSEALGAIEVLLITSGAGVVAIEELSAWVTGAAILAEGRTVGRRAFRTAEFLSVLLIEALPGGPLRTDPGF
jgi:hypothetical protein